MLKPHRQGCEAAEDEILRPGQLFRIACQVQMRQTPQSASPIRRARLLSLSIFFLVRRRARLPRALPDLVQMGNPVSATAEDDHGGNGPQNDNRHGCSPLPVGREKNAIPYVKFRRAKCLGRGHRLRSVRSDIDAANFVAFSSWPFRASRACWSYFVGLIL